MWFERPEREITDGEPWSEFSGHKIEWGGERQNNKEVDCSRQKQPSKRWFKISLVKYWHNILG